MTDWDNEFIKAEQKERAHEERLDRIGSGLERLAAAIERLADNKPRPIIKFDYPEDMDKFEEQYPKFVGRKE